jgi:hypothetical protein
VADILDAFDAASGPERLELVRLGVNPVMLMVFTRESEAVRVHWEEDPSVGAYVRCAGVGCPACYVHEAPSAYQLLPVLDVAKRKVGVLMVSMTRGPASLGAQLLPHLRDEQVHNKLFLVSRERAKYAVDVRPLGEHADRFLGAIEAFSKARIDGLSLRSALPMLSALELAEVPRVRTKLDALGGWTPPGA